MFPKYGTMYVSSCLLLCIEMLAAFRVWVACMQAVRNFLQGIRESLGLDVYSFSVFHVFFEQYLSIGRDAVVLLVAALVAVTIITLLFTASLWASAMILLVLCMILVRPRSQLQSFQ